MLDPRSTTEGLTRLEAQSQRLRWMVLGLCALLILSLNTSRPGAPQAAPDILRVKGLVVEDAAGRDRLQRLLADAAAHSPVRPVGRRSHPAEPVI